MNTKYICQWSLEIVLGKQKQAVEILKDWGIEKFNSSRFQLSDRDACKLMNGFIGKSPSLIIDGYTFSSLDDFEKALSDMSQPQFRQHAEALSEFIIPGSQKWTIYKMKF